MLRDDIVKRAQNETNVESIPMEAVESSQAMIYPTYQPAMLTAEDASALQREYYTAGIRTAAAQAETAEYLRRQAAKAALKQQERQMRQYTKDDAEDQNELKSVRVYVAFGKIKIDIVRPDGRTSRPKILIDEDFIEAKTYVSCDNKNQKTTILTFSKKGYPMQVMYSSEMVAKSYADLISILRAHGLGVNVSRRLKTEIEEQLYFFFENIAEEIKLPASVGYFKDETDNWKLAMPGEVTMNSLIGGGSNV